MVETQSRACPPISTAKHENAVNTNKKDRYFGPKESSPVGSTSGAISFSSTFARGKQVAVHHSKRYVNALYEIPIRV